MQKENISDDLKMERDTAKVSLNIKRIEIYFLARGNTERSMDMELISLQKPRQR